MLTGETLAQPQPFTWKGVGHLPPGLVAPHVVLQQGCVQGVHVGLTGGWDPILVIHRNIQLGVRGLPGGEVSNSPVWGQPARQPVRLLGGQGRSLEGMVARARCAQGLRDVADDDAT